MSKPHVLGEYQTLERAFGSSIGRYGDGELRVALGGSCTTQAKDAGLQKELVALLQAPTGPCLPCLPYVGDGPKAYVWERYVKPPFSDLYVNAEYGSAFVTRPDSAPWIDSPAYWARVEDLWRGKDVVLVAGNKRSLTLDTLSSAARVRLVSGKPQNAYTEIDRIEEEVGPHSGIVLICLGVAATVLADRLARKGAHALDLGHLGMFMRRQGAFSINRSALISDEYLHQNLLLHTGAEAFGDSGWKQAQLVLDYAKLLKVNSILDYGCGEGTLKKQLGKLGWTGAVHEYDPAVRHKDAPPKPAELVVCNDVLEHIEPACLDAVLNHMQLLAVNAAYVVISTRLANQILPDGRNAHLSVHEPAWWLDKLALYWNVVRHEGSKRLRVWLEK